ncbi:hypothetical protein [Kutzneria albida]|uniref:PPE family domain-containing protein n=1 Tax=Kutzneria albida DSM 43870 TaxID=1449976 RepID=W5WB87_9PSEU|nr:hypothetical protein [Kutzneria albida]AHH95484.1 hypothetical protein KALB_2115 [Kutzneria albida DSM 43870]
MVSNGQVPSADSARDRYHIKQYNDVPTIEQLRQQAIQEGEAKYGPLFGPLLGMLHSGEKVDQQEQQLNNGVMKRAAPGNPAIHYEGIPHQALYDQVNNEVDSGRVAQAGDTWVGIGNSLAKFGDRIAGAIANSESSWTGASAESARQAIAQVANKSGEAGKASQLAGMLTHQQSSALDSVKANVPKPPANPYDPATAAQQLQAAQTDPVQYAKLADGFRQQAAQEKADHQKAAQAVQTYDQTLSTTAQSAPAFAPPPQVANPGGGETPQPGGGTPGYTGGGTGGFNPGGVGPGGGGGGYRPGGGGTGGTGGVGPGGGGWTPPGQLPGGGGSGSTGTQGTGGSTPPGTGYPPGGIMPPGGYPPGWGDPPTYGGPGPGMPGPGGPGYGLPPGGPGGSGPGGGNGPGGGRGFGPGSGTGGPGAGGPGGRGGFGAGAGSGAAGAGAGGAGSRGAGAGASAGAMAAEEAAGRGGLGGARGAAGQPGAGGMAGQGGKGGKKGEDGEHQRPSWLVEADPDEIFGTDEKVVPPVIGL